MARTKAKGRKNVYHLVPEPVSGYVLDPSHGYFSVIIPEEGINYISNPSAERGSGGYFPLLGSTVAQSSVRARRGIYSISCTPTANPVSGVQYVGSTIASTVTRPISVDVWAEPGISLVLEALVGAGPIVILARTVGKGRWERIGGILYGAGGIPTIIIRKDGSLSTLPFYIDGLQEEIGRYITSYIDGDQIGYKVGLLDYYWLSIPHDGPSIRTKNCRSGGRIIPLKDYGLEVMSFMGLGMSEVEADIMAYGTLDGGEYHNTHTPPRSFTIMGAMFGRDRGDLPAKRKKLIDALKPDLVSPKQPLVLRYEISSDCNEPGLILELPSIYTGGLSGQFDNHHQERIALNLVAPWPYLLEEGNDSKILDDLDSTNSQSWAVRDTGGLWHNYGNVALGAGVGTIYEIIQSDYRGGLLVAGDFDTLGGNPCEGMFFLNLASRATEVYTPWADDTIYCLHEAPNGYVYMGGAFHTIGINGRLHIAYMDDGDIDYDLAGGTDGIVRTIAVTYNGDVYVGGDFANVGTGIGAVVAAYIAMYDVSAAAWVNITPLGDPNGRVNKILVGADGKIYIGGAFSTVNSITCNHVAVYDPVTAVWDNLGAGMTGGNVLDICFGKDGRLYACGDFTAPGGYAAVFNGANWEWLGSGILDTTIGTTVINRCTCGPDGKIWFSGDFAIQGPYQRYNCEYASWDGSTFGYMDGQPPAQADLQACDGLAICVTNANEIAVSFDYSTATPGALFYCGQPQTIYNLGSAIAHPTLTCQISGGQYDYLYIRNVTTGNELRFALVMDDGGRFWIDMTPNNIRSWSNYRPVEQTLFDGSDLATFIFMPGENRIVVYSNRSRAGTTADTGFFWRNNHWSADSGVV